EAGIALQGTEIKSLKEHHASLDQAYVRIKRKELWLMGSSIQPYKFGNVHNHEEKRERKLLMHHYEIVKLEKSIQEKGLSLIPLSMYLKKGKVKVKIGLAKGKKLYDKREAIKEKEQKKAIARIAKQY
ncbi:MAG TPA: SsrA-binding protein SmpB, partial [Chlamydiales bacterium]|nr:SsrA-binding protein SmpB [Chlamydiales bacterium]